MISPDQCKGWRRLDVCSTILRGRLTWGKAEIQASSFGSTQRSIQNNWLGGICFHILYAIILSWNSEDINNPFQCQGGREDPESIGTSYKSHRCCLYPVRKESPSCFSALWRKREVLPASQEYDREAAGQESYSLIQWQGKPGDFLVGHPGDAIPYSFQSLGTLLSMSVVEKHRKTAECEQLAGWYCSATSCHSCTKAAKHTRDQRYGCLWDEGMPQCTWEFLDQ